MTFKQYGVDVASYQPSDVGGYHGKGADFCIVKLTQGTGYFNPRATAQVASSRKNHMYTHAYHYAEFGASVSKAKAEAAYFIKAAKRSDIDISKKRYLWLDWEQGSGNVVTAGKAASTAAVIAFMEEVKKAGWHVGLYSGFYVLRDNLDYSKIVDKFGTCLWVASYPVAGAQSKAMFGYFPSLKGVAVWQFTDNFKGLGVDGNVAVVDLHKAPAKAKKEAPKKAAKIASDAFEHVVKVNSLGRGKESWKVRLLNAEGHYTDTYVPQGTSWKTHKVRTIKSMKCYLIGNDVWIPAKFVTVTK